MAKVVMRVLSISITVLFCVLVVCGLYQVGLKCYDFGYRVYTEPAVSEGKGTEQIVQITEDMGTKELAELLEEKGLVRDNRLFYLQAKLSGFDLEPGVYKVSTAMTARELMAAMTPVEEEAEE
ncbi:MAG: aminodeoxychorismate lyase [bacterium]|nr:aminodeoxychorismate lyase [bacterium]MDY4099283.1 aminodeoxychorismate lyase [Lachnospiraceae bacterium]